MKTINLVILASLMIGTAYAQMFEGVVTKVDVAGKSVSLIQSNTQQETAVKVNDTSAFEKIKVGSPVRVEANNDSNGWTATSIKIPAAVQSPHISLKSAVCLERPLLGMGEANILNSSAVE